MNELPPAPKTLRYGKVAIIFVRVTEGDNEKGFVPGYHFKIETNDEAEVGHINFRVGDSEHVRLAAGHIGYEVATPHRGHGYAADACLALAPFIAKVSGSVLITTDPDNIPSIKTIERIGAIYKDEVNVPENDPHHKRGSKRKKRYIWRPGMNTP